jgi:hypothetical protein
MKFQIDNFDGSGVHDYSSAIESTGLPQITRRLNKAAELRLSLVADNPNFVVPANGARVTLALANGQNIFTGYLTAPPAFEYLGWGTLGPMYRYLLSALSDEMLLDRKRLPDQPPFVARSAGTALQQLSQELLPGVFNTSAVQNLDSLPSYVPDPQKKWSAHAAEIALETRGSYRTLNGALILSSAGSTSYSLNESDASFSPDGLKLTPVNGLINDVTVFGLSEPQAYVRDYFVGDGVTLRFYLSQTSFARSNRTVVEEEYTGTTIDTTRWTAADPTSAITVNSGKLQVAGGTGVDGQTTVQFAEPIELGGAFVLQHGDVTFTGTSDGVLGGLYVTTISTTACLAGFRVTPNGVGSNIQALVNGGLIGPVMTTTPGHHYVLTTRFYALEIYRKQQAFHSSARPAGNPRGGGDVNANVRMVLEVHDVDPANPGSMIAPSTVLYDSVISSAPGYCLYSLVNSASLHCAIAFTRLIQAVDTEVRSAPPGAAYRTRLVGSLADGAECQISSSGPALQFFSAHVPAPNELIEVRYRGHGLALTRVTNPTSIAAQANGNDDGVRAVVRDIKSPQPRTAADCDDATGTAWSGEYQCWSDFLPQSALDIFPGDALAVSTPTRGAAFSAIVREVQIQVKDLDGEHSAYKVSFADDASVPLAFEFQSGRIKTLPAATPIAMQQIGVNFVADLTLSSITLVTSTTVTLDAGVVPPAGGGIEVRWSDFGWGPDNDRNLVGRFSTQSFTVPRLSRVQDYFLRQFDASTPPRYSRYTAALHVDYPL